jgi:hypothetical protein
LGWRAADVGFSGWAGRLCVPLPRPPQACLVVGREGDELPEDQPSTPAYVGWDPDPVPNGWVVPGQEFQAFAFIKVTA